MTLEEPRLRVQREPRRQLQHHSGWMTIDDGATRCACTVLDVSPGGARIVTDIVIDVRDQFGLALAQDHAMHRQCEVVWRRGKTYGVKFVQ